MKRIKYILVLIAAVALSSCVNLDIAPVNLLTDEDTFGSEYGITAYMAKMYRDMPMEDFQCSPRKGWNATNISSGFGAWSGITGEALARSQSSQSHLDWFSEGYAMLREINVFMETLPDFAGRYSKNDVDKWLGEAYFLRAFAYYTMAIRYGGVVIVNKTLEYPNESGNLDDYMIPRSSEEETWAQVASDYDKAIELYPDFAKAYMNRSYVESRLGLNKESKRDYDIARRKIDDYRDKTGSGEASFADTTKKYSSLLSLDADFAKKDFDDEMLQHRDVDIKLRPLFRFVLSDKRDNVQYALKNRYENPLIDKFLNGMAVPVVITNSDTVRISGTDKFMQAIYSGHGEKGVAEFQKALADVADKQFNSAQVHYDNAIDSDASDKYAKLYKVFYYMNRAVLRADMIDFISSIENNVQTLTMDDQGTTRARVKDQVSRSYDYSDAVEDMQKAVEIVGDVPYVYFNLANLQCLSSSYVDAIGNFTKAISLYPYMGDAYFNRGLVLIYLKDKEKGCIDLSHAGELGIEDAYGVIKKYCETNNGE